MKHSPFIVGDFNIKSIKEDDPDNFIVEGFGSVFGNVDLARDVVMAGAFAVDLLENGKERTILWQHRSDQPIGLGTFSESPEGLKVSMKLPKADEFVSNKVMPQIKVGAVKGLSIGYAILEETFDRVSNVNQLNKLKLRELSIVTFPCNELAQITAAKEYIKANDHSEVREFKMYPLADEKTEWNEKEAIESIKANTGCESDASRNYYKGFLNFTDDSKSFDDYKLPYVKYIDNEFRIVPNAIYQIAGSLQGKSGNEDVKEFINSVYVKMGKEEPFKSAGKFFADKSTLKNMRKSDLKSVFDNENVILSSGSKEMIIEALRSPAPGGSIPSGDKSSILDALKKANEDMETI